MNFKEGLPTKAYNPYNFLLFIITKKQDVQNISHKI